MSPAATAAGNYRFGPLQTCFEMHAIPVIVKWFIFQSSQMLRHSLNVHCEIDIDLKTEIGNLIV